MGEYCEKCTKENKCCTTRVCINRIENAVFRGMGFKTEKDGETWYLMPNEKGVCPLFDIETQKCGRYELRPLRCKFFPLLKIESSKKGDNKAYFTLQKECTIGNENMDKIDETDRNSLFYNWTLFNSIMMIEWKAVKQKTGIDQKNLHEKDVKEETVEYAYALVYKEMLQLLQLGLKAVLLRGIQFDIERLIENE